MITSTMKSTIIIFIGFLLTIGCEDPAGSTIPESATIEGTITFSGSWPGDDILFLALSSNWPPTGAPAASSIIISTDLQSNTYDYIFENVTFATYGAITVSWLDTGDPNSATNQHILGSYGRTPDSEYGPYLDAMSVTVSDTAYALTGMDFSADLSLATNQ